MPNSKKVRIRKRKLADALDNYIWQTDPDLARLNAIPVQEVQETTFDRYLAGYWNEIRHPSPDKHVFAIETLAGSHIGTCSCYNIDETRGEGELGIMIGNRDCRDKGYGADTVNTLLNHIYRATKLNRIYLKTLHSNHRAQRCFEKCGFTTCGHLSRDGCRFILMEISRQRWQERQ